VNFVGRRQVKVRITHAAVEAGRNPKSFSESASERLQRTVVGVQGDVRDRHSGMRPIDMLLFPTIAVVAWLPDFFDHVRNTLWN